MSQEQSRESLRNRLQDQAERHLDEQLRASGLTVIPDDLRLQRDVIARSVESPTDPSKTHTIKVSVTAREDGEFILGHTVHHPDDTSEDGNALIIQVSNPDFTPISKAVESISSWQPTA